MLTESQIALIDALPNEGGAYYLHKGEKIAYPQDAIDEAARLPLPRASTRQARPSGTNGKVAIILHGAPGSGKTYAGMRRLETLVSDHPELAKTFGVISYDEDGAIFDIQEYGAALCSLSPEMKTPETPVNPATRAAREQLWRDFQPLSQYIRSQTLKIALKEEQNLYIDTTSSGMGTLKLVELLRDLDYTHIEFWSYHNHLDLATERITSRPRPTSDDDLYQKRIGAYEMLPKIIAAADRVSLSVNDSNYNAPEEFAVYRAGQYVSGHGNIAASLAARLEMDQERFQRACSERYGPAKARELSDRLRGARAQFAEIIAPAVNSVWTHYHHRLDRDLT